MLQASRASPGAPAPIAQWDFAAGDPLASTVSGHRLVQGPGSAAHQVAGPDGAVMRFDGARDHLVVPNAEIGALDVGRSGDCVSVFALLARRGAGTGFIAGVWQEDDEDPQRQYGLFVHLPTYGGADQVAGHVSAHGAASPGLPYSRDYSATARRVPHHHWKVVGFTYDGRHARSFLDGLGDARGAYTEPGAPLGEGLTYDKNPYHYPHGLKNSSTSPFTVGAVTLTRGLGNFFRGDIARLAVWDRALDNRQALALAAHWGEPGAPLACFDFAVAHPGGQADRRAVLVPVGAAGWTQELLAPGVGDQAGLAICSSPAGDHLCRREGNGFHRPAVAAFPLEASLRLGDVERACYSDLSRGTSESVELAVKVGGRWLSAAGAREDLAGAQQVSVPFAGASWREVTTGAPVAVAGSADLQALGLVARGDRRAGLRVSDLMLYPPAASSGAPTTNRAPREAGEPHDDAEHDAHRRVTST